MERTVYLNYVNEHLIQQLGFICEIINIPWLVNDITVSNIIENALVVANAKIYLNECVSTIPWAYLGGKACLKQDRLSTNGNLDRNELNGSA